MQIVITMAGLGSRFRKAGYTVPKYEITVRGKSLFYWSMESLRGFFDPRNEYYFIVRSEDNAGDFIKKEWESITGSSEHCRIIELAEPTDGQATTAMRASAYWDKDDSLLIYNIDTYVEAGQMKSADIEGDGFIPCFKAEGDHWSFVEIGSDGNATEVREKERISDNCTLGAYYFKTCRLFEQMYEQYYADSSNMERGEKYVAPLYNHMISLGMKVRICLVDPGSVHVLGTPEELEAFSENRS